MTTPITTTTELEALPEKTPVRDRYGDVGIVQAGKVHYPETAPQTFERAIKKYGPLTVLRPGDNPAANTPAAERIDGHWLVEDVKKHTCGAGGEHGHEPDCGTIPLVDLSGLPGWDTLVADVLADAPTVKPGREEVYAIVRDLVRDKGNVVYEWPDDEAAAYRDHDGFSEGMQAVEDLRAEKGTLAVLAILPGKSEQEIRADQQDMDLAMHHAYRPEVVAELAVHLSEESDWEAIAKWCGGTVDSGPDGTDSGEWVGWIALPDKTHVFEGMWIVQRHDLTFDVRYEVEGPSERSLAQVRAEALRDAADALAKRNFLLPRGHAPMPVLVDYLRVLAYEEAGK